VFLEEIPASESFANTGVREVASYVRDTFVDAQPLYDEVPIKTRGELEADIRDGITLVDVPFFSEELAGDFLFQLVDFTSPKTFRTNRDTLADVVDWLKRVTGVFLYFRSQPDGSLCLVIDATPTTESFQARTVGGRVSVRNNNALYDISPRNALIYKGRSKSSLASLGEFELTMPSDKYPSVEVYHEPSVGRTDGQRFYGRTVEGDAINLDDAATQAKVALKERMGKASGGRIECDIDPLVRPYATIEARPACNDDVVADVPTYTYEIEEVTHKVTATKGARTDLHVSPHVALEDIVVDKQSDNYGMKKK
jgi:hypothetical protein